MTAIFTGLGSGINSGSAAVLGGAGLLGGGTMGRSGEQALINAANGNLILQQRDEMLVGRGPDDLIARTYNSQGDFNGLSWRMSTDRRVFGLNGTLNSANSIVRRLEADGTANKYAWDSGRGAYVTPKGSGAYDTLSWNAGTSTWTWTDGDSQATETYGHGSGTQYLITAETDASGNTLTFSYVAGTDKIDKVTTANGEYIQYGWSGNNITQITTVAGGTSTRTRYSYDGSGRLSSVSVDLTPDDNSIADGKVYTTTYTYVGATSLVASITQSDGSSLAIGYDGSNRVHTLTQAVSSGVSRTTTIDYYSGYSVVTDAAGQATTLYYDLYGNLTQITAPAAYAGAAQQVTQFGYNANGDVTSVTDAMGNASTFSFDSNGNMLTSTDRLGNVITRTYGSKNELLTETRTGADATGTAVQHTTRYVYDTYDRLVFTLDAEGRVVEHRYGSYGLPSFDIGYPAQTYNVGALASNAAPTKAQMDAWVSGLSDPTAVSQVEYAYDARGNLTTSWEYGAALAPGNGGHAPGENNTLTFYSYDRAGQLLSRNTYLHTAETFVYDGLGRLTGSVDAAGGVTSLLFNDSAQSVVVTLSNGLVRTSTYNLAGDLISTSESGSYTTTGTASAAYDRLGRARMTTDATGHNAYIVYDNAGRKVADVDHYGNMTEYKYDADDRVIATVRYAAALTSSQITTLQTPTAAFPLASNRPAANAGDLWTWTIYDKESRVVETIDGSGHATAFEYDGSGQLVRTTAYYTTLAGSLATFQATPPTTVTLPAADAAHDTVSRIFYDKAGRVIGTLDGEGYLSITSYDGQGRKVAETALATAAGGNRATDSFNTLVASAGTSAADRTAHYVYDGHGRVVFAIDAANRVTEFVYIGDHVSDVTGDVHQTIRYAGVIATPGAWTAAGVRTALSNAGLTSNANNRTSWAVYNTHNQLSYTIDASGAVTGYRYDGAGNLIKTISYVTLRPTTSLPSNTEMNNWAGGSPDDRVTRNYYNARGELIFTVDAEGYVSRIDYDAEGRQIATVRWDTAISVSDSTTIAQIGTAATGNYVANTIVYDNDGRVSATSDGEGVVTLNVYNYNGTVQSVFRATNTPDQVQTYFVYDGAGRVVSRYDAWGTAEQAVTSYSYDGMGNVLTVTDATGAVTTNTYDHVGRLLTQTDALSGGTAFQYDAFDQVVKTTDARNAVTYTYYDALGRVVAVRDAEDYVTESAYTVFGELQSVTRRANKATNTASVATLPAYVANAADATTSFVYDKLGHVVTTTDAMGVAETTSYNAFGQATQTVGKLGLVTTMSYDHRGLLTVVHVNAAVSNAAGSQVAAGYDSHRYQYDARGNVLSDTEAYGLAEQRVTTFVYDRLNRVTERHLPAVQNATNAGLVYPVEYLTYDRRGNVIESKDAAGARTLNYYDKLGRVIVQIDPLGAYQTFAYANVVGTGSTVTARSYDGTVTLPATAGGTPPAAPGGAYRETVTSYDKLGRQVSQAVTNAFVGAWNGSNYYTVTGTLTSSWQYDAAGNVVKTVQPSQAATYSYYDKLGRQTAQVDAGGYMTAWTRDAEGNVLSERRYATAATGTAVGTPPSVATVADDRVTNFTYDKMGRRLSETRVNVGGWAIDNVSTGSLIQTAPNNVASDATIIYTYNALGEVLSKREATGETTTYAYDSAGRMTSTTGAAFADYTAASVQGTFGYSYDALGNVVRTVQNGSRITTYAYGAGGRLQSMTDPAAAVHGYYYDIAGRKTGESWDRTKSNGTTVLHEGMSYQYDLAGNLVRQAFATVSNGTFSDAGDVTTLTYNSRHQVTARALNGMAQDQNRYDALGRLEASSSGDGVWRYYLYDANGNRTAEIDDEGKAGVNLVNQSLASVLATATANGGNTLGGAYIDGVNVTITAYDARNLATSAIQTKRQLTETGTAVDIVSSRTYKAFGETATDTDALGHVTTYTYNRMGRATAVQHAAVTVGLADGTTATQTPTDTYYYDISGRLIGQRDANGFLTSRSLLAGTGYGQAAALVVKEYHPDGGVVANAYDVFGDLRTTTDAIGRATTSSYDAMGRLAQVNHAGGLVDYYNNDVLGQRTRHYNNVLGSAVVETTDYDVQGRVTASTAFGGDATTISYSWNNTIATSGLGSFGGYEQVTTYANGLTTRDTSDAFGHATSHTDMGARTTYISYDTAGRLVQRTVSGETQIYNYLNTGVVGSVSGGYGTGGSYYETSHATYGYDALGEKTSEAATANGVTIQNATASYDAAGRMTNWSDSGTALAGTYSVLNPAASVTWSYDAVGNVRSQTRSYWNLNGNGVADYHYVLTTWYRFDSMNRVVTDGGVVTGSQIVRGASGIDLTYDLSGQRKTATSNKWLSGQVQVWVQNPGMPRQFDDPDSGHWETQDRSYQGVSQEAYSYNDAGNLTAATITTTGYYDDGNGNAVSTGVVDRAMGGGSFTYDGLGRQTRQIDTVEGGTIVYDHSQTWDGKGRVSYDTVSQRSGNDTIATYTYNYFNDGAGSAYALGAVTSNSVSNYKNGSYQSASTTTNTYASYDGAVLSQVAYALSGQSTKYTTYTNSAAGVFQSAYVGDGRPRTISVTNDALGQAVRRDEADNVAWNQTTYQGGDPHEAWYRYNGKQIGYTGNDGTYDSSYAGSESDRTRATANGAFRFGASYGAATSDFGERLTPVNSWNQGSSGGSYTVRSGDTLASIASQLWGDASLWYKLAQANGLGSDAALVAGQMLTVPSGVMKNGDNASTFKPYDVSQAYGDTSPTTPTPQAAAKKNKCGVLGAILMVVIAVAIVAILKVPIANLLQFGTVTAPTVGGFTVAGLTIPAVTLTAGTAATIGGAAIAGAVGSIVSQGFGLATGIQDKFSWKGVALAGIGAGVGAGVGALGIGKIAGSAFLGNVANGAISNIATQGIGVATGLQKKFDWAGVAAAGIGGGVGGAVGGKLGVASLAVDRSIGNILATGTASMAGGIANAATRSLINGTDFGDNLMAALPDIIGQTIGDFVGQTVLHRHDRAIFSRAFEEASTSPELKPLLQKIAYECGGKITPDRLVAYLSATSPNLSDKDRLLAIRANVVKYIDRARDTAIENGGSLTNVALAQNAAIITVYSALALTHGNFQWTYVGGFVALQVRQEIQKIANTSGIAGLTASMLFPGSAPSSKMGTEALKNHLISALIAGQRHVVEDIVPMALTYFAIGDRVLNAIGPGQPHAVQGFRLQVQADTAQRNGDYQRAAFLGMQAATELGIHEQIGLQPMWNDPILGKLASLGTESLDINTPAGIIKAPPLSNSNPALLQNRIAIAKNAFVYMYQHVFGYEMIGPGQTPSRVKVAEGFRAMYDAFAK